jgi:hypothetical protein
LRGQSRRVAGGSGSELASVERAQRILLGCVFGWAAFAALPFAGLLVVTGVCVVMARAAGLCRATGARSCFKPVRRFVAARDGSNGGEPSSSPMIGEGVLARLRAAEEEAAKLRSQLAAAQGDKVGAGARARGGAAARSGPLRTPSQAAHRFAAGHAACLLTHLAPCLAIAALPALAARKGGRHRVQAQAHRQHGQAGDHSLRG